jgi:hypothetical protein
VIATAVASYNGISFVSPMVSSASVKPVLAPDGRVLYVEHRLMIDAWIVADSPGTEDTGATLENMRSRLNQVGKQLNYTDKGLGTINVNPPGNRGQRDAALGPNPQELGWEPLGGEGNAARIKWAVVFRLPHCLGQERTRYEGLMSLTWEVTHELDIDAGGLATERVQGTIEVGMTFRDDGSLPFSVDDWREVLDRRQPPVGFQRSSPSYQISADRRKLNFSWQERELVRPMHAGITKARANHEISSSFRDQAFASWRVMIDGSFTVARGASRGYPLLAFLALVGSRMAGFMREGKHVLTQTLSFRDEVFTLTSHFSFSATVICTSDLGSAGGFFGGRRTGPTPVDSVLRMSKLWTPIDGQNYNLWAKSMRDESVWSCRGRAGLREGPPLASPDLCDGQPLSPRTNNAGPVPKEPNSRTPPEEDPAPLPGTPGNPPPPGGTTPGSPGGWFITGTSWIDNTLRPLPLPNLTIPMPQLSWLAFRNKITLHSRRKVVFHKPLPARPPKLPPGTNPPPPPKPPVGIGPGLAGPSGQRLGPGLSTSGSLGGPSSSSSYGSLPPSSESHATASAEAAWPAENMARLPGAAPGLPELQGDLPPERAQVNATPDSTMFMEGYGIRLGHRVVPPKITRFGKMKVEETERLVTEDYGIFGAGGDLIVYRTDWLITYRILNAGDGKMPRLANPAEGTDGEE